METSKDYIRTLIRRVESTFGRQPNSPADFAELANSIAIKTHSTISVSTLKRLWGYVKGYKQPRLYTLNVLSRYIENENWTDFLKSLSLETSSDFITSKTLFARDIPEGQYIEVTWEPNRRCIFQHLKGNEFIVKVSDNSKLSVGDTFKCQAFRDGQPLYLEDLFHIFPHRTYVAGVCHGVLWRIFPSE